MSGIVAIGRSTDLAGYALAGARVVDASDGDRVRRAWAELAPDVDLVLLTAEAYDALPEPVDRRDVLWVVLPT